MNTNVLLALAAGFVAGWWLKSRQAVRTLPGGAAPTGLPLQALFSQPAPIARNGGSAPTSALVSRFI